MSLFAIGSTFRIKNHDGKLGHLWVVIGRSNGTAIAVNFTTYRGREDTSCLMQPGDHPFISHPTVAFYAAATAFDREQQDSMRGDPRCVEERECSGALVKRLLEGALRSKHTPNAIKKLLSQ